MRRRARVIASRCMEALGLKCIGISAMVQNASMDSFQELSRLLQDQGSFPHPVQPSSLQCSIKSLDLLHKALESIIKRDILIVVRNIHSII